jgi:hypothetical protein
MNLHATIVGPAAVGWDPSLEAHWLVAGQEHLALHLRLYGREMGCSPGGEYALRVRSQ